MINEALLNELKPIISDPGWKILVHRFKDILTSAELKLFNAKTFDEFKEAKGAHSMAKRLYELLSKPDSIADDGVYKPKPTTET